MLSSRQQCSFVSVQQRYTAKFDFIPCKKPAVKESGSFFFLSNHEIQGCHCLDFLSCYPDHEKGNNEKSGEGRGMIAKKKLEVQRAVQSSEAKERERIGLLHFISTMPPNRIDQKSSYVFATHVTNA